MLHKGYNKLQSRYKNKNGFEGLAEQPQHVTREKHVSGCFQLVIIMVLHVDNMIITFGNKELKTEKKLIHEL